MGGEVKIGWFTLTGTPFTEGKINLNTYDEYWTDAAKEHSPQWQQGPTVHAAPHAHRDQDVWT